MDLRKFSRRFLLSSLAIALGTLSFTAFASRACGLGDSCNVEQLTGTYFKIAPFWGSKYLCDVTSEGGSLKFFIVGGGHFSIKDGFGYYNANPFTTVEINGKFKAPNERDEWGEIRIVKLPFSAKGTVRCYPKF